MDRSDLLLLGQGRVNICHRKPEARWDESGKSLFTKKKKKSSMFFAGLLLRVKTPQSSFEVKVFSNSHCIETHYGCSSSPSLSFPLAHPSSLSISDANWLDFVKMSSQLMSSGSISSVACLSPFSRPSFAKTHQCMQCKRTFILRLQVSIYFCLRVSHIHLSCSTFSFLPVRVAESACVARALFAPEPQRRECDEEKKTAWAKPERWAFDKVCLRVTFVPPQTRQEKIDCSIVCRISSSEKRNNGLNIKRKDVRRMSDPRLSAKSTLMQSMIPKRSQMCGFRWKKVVNIILARDPNYFFLFFFQGPIICREDGGWASVGGGVVRKNLAQSVSKGAGEQMQLCNRRRRKKDMTFENKVVSYSNPSWKLPNQSTVSVSVSLWSLLFVSWATSWKTNRLS